MLYFRHLKKRSFHRAGMDAFLAFERRQSKKKERSTVTTSRSFIERPIEPKEEDCCGLDCQNCVFIEYQEKLLDYEASLVNTFIPVEPLEEQFDIHYHPKQIDWIGIPQASCAKVIKNIELCRQPTLPSCTFRSTKHIELELPNSIRYQAADNVAIHMPNSSQLIDRCALLLNVNPKQWFTYTPTNGKVLKNYSVYHALKWYCDLTSIPRRNSLRTLAAMATDPKEQEGLLQLSQYGKNTKYEQEIVQPQCNVVDVLEQYSSVRPTFGLFLQSITPMSPRYYTISSSPLADRNTLVLTVRVLKQFGTCSNYLAQLNPNDKVLLSIQPSSFRLPASSTPVVMIGPGTGIAPFRAMLTELKHETTKRRAVLITGCQHPAVDLLYKSELETAKAEGVLENVLYAFSRTKTSQYVQDVFKANTLLIDELLIQSKGTLYVCGSQAMGQAIKRAFHRLLRQYYPEKEAKAKLQKLMKEGNYVEEVWAA